MGVLNFDSGGVKRLNREGNRKTIRCVSKDPNSIQFIEFCVCHLPLEGQEDADWTKIWVLEWPVLPATLGTK